MKYCLCLRRWFKTWKFSTWWKWHSLGNTNNYTSIWKKTQRVNFTIKLQLWVQLKIVANIRKLTDFRMKEWLKLFVSNRINCFFFTRSIIYQINCKTMQKLLNKGNRVKKIRSQIWCVVLHLEWNQSIIIWSQSHTQTTWTFNCMWFLHNYNTI